MAAGKAPTRLKLDRGLGSPLFGSWRLDSEADVRHGAHGLPGRVQPPLAGGSGFLQTKTVVTHNHVHQQPGGTYVFLQVSCQQCSAAQPHITCKCCFRSLIPRRTVSKCSCSCSSWHGASTGRRTSH